MSLVTAFLMVVGHDPRKFRGPSSRSTLLELVFALGFCGMVALFVAEMLLN